ncbi:MAG: mRNA interferase RelE/StbE [Thermoplasmata archaeon]|jgi:mRNA-degrading endonuclease RelE of RelBE toxin-antitoxin system|nr:mRNA interferase RelE/StbE [Thermoplasmata archaeon]
MALRYAAGTRDYLATLAPHPRRDIREALRLLAEDPRHPRLDVKQLRVRGQIRFYRFRVRDYRVIYSPRPDHTYVWRIQHRSEGYGWLDRLDPP